jgi:hypothetical protein
VVALICSIPVSNAVNNRAHGSFLDVRPYMVKMTTV